MTTGKYILIYNNLRSNNSTSKMEAIARHEFRATAEDELSFSKGEVVKVLSYGDDENWFKAECEGREGYVPKNYIDVREHPWYKGQIKRCDAEAKLLEKDGGGHYIHPDGAFLVRDSESAPGEFSLSVKFQESAQHFKIFRDKGKYFLWVVKFNSLHELIEYHRMASVHKVQSIFLRDMIYLRERPMAYALYDFEGKDAEELSFCRGDLITVLNQDDMNWWKGELNGNQGLIPANYVKIKHK